MSISEQLRALVTAMADVQRTASFDTQCRVAEAATILVREAGRLESGTVEVLAVDVKVAGGGR